MRSRITVSILLGAVSLIAVGCAGEDLVAPEPGAIAVTTTTSGEEPDADGYTIRLDQGEPMPIGPQATLTLPVPPGEHTLELGEVAPNCVVSGELRRAVSVPAGESVEALFAVVCHTTRGTLGIRALTTGGWPDPDGYSVQIDQEIPVNIEVNGSLQLPGIQPGAHLVRITGLALNCELAGENPRPVLVTLDAPAAVEFAIDCPAGVAQWTPVPSGSRADFTNVWSDGRGQAFTIGERDIPGGLEGVLLHREDESWVPRLREEDLRPRAVWGSSAAEVYVVGYGFLDPAARILRYDGAAWASDAGFDGLGVVNAGFESIWGSSASDIFAVGWADAGPFNVSLIYHYDGSRWQQVVIEGPVNPPLEDVWGSSPTDVYAVGMNQSSDPSLGTILHYDGAAWTPVLQEEGLFLNGVWGSSATDVFAVGFQVEEVDGEFFVSGAIRHFDGGSWAPMTLPADAGVLNEVWGTSGSDVYAVGSDGLILRYDGTAWTATAPTPETLLGVWQGEPGEVLAVGTGGTILSGIP